MIRRVGRVLPLVAAAVALSAVANAQKTTRVSVDSSGGQADNYSAGDVISADGRYVAFFSFADNLVPGDGNHRYDVFVHDRATGVVERVSVDSSGQEGDADSSAPSISNDGRYVAFESDATNLVAGDTTGHRDIFVRDRVTGTTSRASVDSSGNEADDHCFAPSISGDGQLVSFESGATNLAGGGTNGTFDVFLHDFGTSITTRVSVDSNGAQGNGPSSASALSGDGAFVAFRSHADNLVDGDTNRFTDVFVHELATGVTTRVSVASDGSQGNSASGYDSIAISKDGHVVAFMSVASDLVAGDGNGFPDVFVHDLVTGKTKRVSVADDGSEANYGGFWPALSGDGNKVVFQSSATNLVAGDKNGLTDVFVRDRFAGTTTRVSVSTIGDESDQDVEHLSVSADGLLVTWSSYATTLVADDTNGTADVFVSDRRFVVDAARWSNYGAGLAGTLGVPQLVASAAPVFGTTIDIDATDSSTAWCVGFMVLGLQPASFPVMGGTLLVTPLAIPAVPVSPWGWKTTTSIPDDDSLVNLSLFAQLFELDPGAVRGVSMSPGLELHFGK